MPINISELRSPGSELFMDSESYLNELTESDSVYGGGDGANVGYYIDFVEIVLESFDKLDLFILTEELAEVAKTSVDGFPTVDGGT